MKIIIFLLIVWCLYSQNVNNIDNKIVGKIESRDRINPFLEVKYENKDYWIKIISLCPEGEIECKDMIYIGINKSNGSYIVLKGNVYLVNNNFGGYIFKNNNYRYIIDRYDLLTIFEGDKIIKESKLKME